MARRRPPFPTQQRPTHRLAVDEKRHRTRHHRPPLETGVLASLLRKRQSQGGQRHGGRGAEDAREALGFEEVADEGEGRDDQPAKDEPNE